MIGICMLSLGLVVSPLSWAEPAAEADPIELLGPMERGHRAYVTGDFQGAVQLWKPLAEMGSAQAQFYLSTLYASGEGVGADSDAALVWLTKAAQAGYPAAQFNLGNRYYQGRWVQRDYAKAAKWWRKAGDQLVPQAAYNLGSLYYKGKGVDRDLSKAVLWYNRAADAGSVEAKAVLAKLESLATDPQTAPVVTSPSQTARPTATKKSGPASKPIPPVRAAKVMTPLHSAQWIRQQPRTHYAIQVYAGSSLESVGRFAQGFSASGQINVFGFTRDGKPYYALILGSYPSKAQASEAAAKLIGQSTWVRSFASIQNVMVAN